MARKWALRSLRDSSVVLKFHVFFVVMSLLPLTILFYLYWQIKESGQIPVSVDELNNVLLLVSVGILVGYFSMRMLLKGLVDVVHSSTRRLKEILGPQALQDVLKADEDEIEALTQSFNEVTARLMENVSDLEATRKTLRSVLIRVGHGGVGVSSITAFFDLIVETITNALDGRKGFLLVVDDEKGGLIPRATYGVPLKSLEGVRVPLDSGIFLPVLQGRMTAIIPGVSNVHGQELLSGLLEYPLICAPLLVNDR
ncbi:MAG: hypothetical protein GX606_05080, partial [Elusimicrobia bacterium]|nr:hypothetical protein [Elusimicrobiota bacterium]